MIPEDSMLRRHYLTELKNKQQSIFEDFTSIAIEGKGTQIESLPEAPSSLPFFNIVTGLAIFFVLVLIF